MEVERGEERERKRQREEMNSVTLGNASRLGC